jgi:hypothetical protein
MFGGFQVGAFQPLPAYQQVSQALEETFSGGWFFRECDSEWECRRKKRKRLEELEADSALIADETTREIALLLRRQEAEDERRQELERLRSLAQRSDRAEFDGRLARAHAAALADGTAKALIAFERAIEEAREEEEILMLLTMLDD